MYVYILVPVFRSFKQSNRHKDRRLLESSVTAVLERINDI